ncbi:MAG: hypothetical protein MZV64_36050 [Ignavibacteriales bacterium]|nr:hypothetical protein [Ignavibacteriales bacterium]
MLVAGKWLGTNLGTINFLGKFIASIGDILGMILTLFAALVGGGVFLKLWPNRIGEFSIRHINIFPIGSLITLFRRLPVHLLWLLLQSGIWLGLRNHKPGK